MKCAPVVMLRSTLFIDRDIHLGLYCVCVRYLFIISHYLPPFEFPTLSQKLAIASLSNFLGILVYAGLIEIAVGFRRPSWRGDQFLEKIQMGITLRFTVRFDHTIA